MRILGLDHIVLRCGDLRRMTDFYTNVLGCSIEKRVDRLGLIHLRAGASLIDLIGVEGELGRVGGAPPAIEARNMDHLCLRIEAFDIGAIRQHFAAHAVELSPVQQNFGAEGDGPSVYFKDPEANTIELKGPSSSTKSHGQN
jgi:glyoxylase I family protein